MLKIFGVSISDLGLRGAVEQIIELTKHAGRHLVVTANPEILVYARRHADYHQVLAQATLIVPDGTGVVMASYVLGRPIKQGRVTGVELVSELAKKSESQGYSLYFFGADNAVLQNAIMALKNKYGNINVIGYGIIPFFNDIVNINEAENSKILANISQKRPDILLVGIGHPKQEYWINKYISQLPVKVAIGVGGTFDYLSGVVKMPPMMFKKFGLEWLWRLIIQPKRFHRIFTAVFVFSFYVIYNSLVRHPGSTSRIQK